MNSDKNSLRRPLTGLIAALSLLVVPVTDALAASLTYNLTQSNVESVLPDNINNYIQVDVTSTVAGTVSFSVTPIFNFAQSGNYGLTSFGFNYTGSNLLSFSDLGGWTVDTNKNQDGFGSFDYVVAGVGNSRLPALTFSVSGLDSSSTSASLDSLLTKSDGSQFQGNQYFAAHLAGISYGNTTSGFFAGGTIAPVPEPETYAMLLAGLGLMGALARRRRID